MTTPQCQRPTYNSDGKTSRCPFPPTPPPCVLETTQGTEMPTPSTRSRCSPPLHVFLGGKGVQRRPIRKLHLSPSLRSDEVIFPPTAASVGTTGDTVLQSASPPPEKDKPGGCHHGCLLTGHPFPPSVSMEDKS